MTKIVRLKTILLPLLASPKNLWACSVCFGGANSDLSRGFYWGILLLLLLPILMFALIAFKIIQSARKKSQQLSNVH